MGEPAVDVDIWIDAAGADQIPGDVVRMSKFRVRLVIVAMREKLEVDFNKMLKNELTITASVGYTDGLAQVLTELQRIPGIADALISHRYDFNNSFQAFAVAGSRDSSKVIIKFPERGRRSDVVR